MIIHSMVRLLISKNFLNNSVVKYLSVAPARTIGQNEKDQGFYGRESFQHFDVMVEGRRKQAQRTVIVDIEKKEDLHNIYSYFSQYGSILNICEYISKSRKVLVEFAEEQSLKDLLKSRLKGNEQFSLPFFKLRLQTKRSSIDLVSSSSEYMMPVTASNLNSLKENLYEELQENSNNMSSQMQILYENLKMSEVGWRLRFLACRKIEWLLPAFLSHGRVLPFGSSVNTFGNNHSDVDMTLSFDSSLIEIDESSKKQNNNGNSRDTVRKNLEVFASLMHNYKLGFSKIMKILNANVPIIKCHEDFTELECDITIHNISGYYMSELLYLYGCSDCRVRPLVYSIRWWASQKHITQTTSPSAKITNFTLTLMILYFLMNTQPKVVPPIRLLNKLSGKSFSIEGITYSYVRDINLVPESTNTMSLEELFRSFLEFYSKFEYRRTGLSLISGNLLNHTESIPLLVQNPIEPTLNVSRNLNFEAIENFREQCQIALRTIELLMRSETDRLNQNGILTFATSNSSTAALKSKKNLNRLIQPFDIRAILYDDKMAEPSALKSAQQHAERLSKQKLKKTTR